MKLHDWIKSIIDSSPGLTQKGLAIAMDLNPAAVNRMLHGARQIKVDELPIIEEYLGHRYEGETTQSVRHMLPNPQEVFGSSELPRSYPPYQNRSLGPRYADTANWSENMVPVYGYSTGGLQSDLNLAKGEIVDWVLRHPALNGIRDAFALYVFSDAMEPRYFAGELVYVHPGRPPETNKDCVVEMKDGQAYLKRFLGQTEDEIRFAQYHPTKETSCPKSDIQALYAVVGRG